MSDAVRLVGDGIHGGHRCTVTLHRRPGPVRFLRGGRELTPEPAAVVATRGCTVLGDDGVRVAMVEHLLGALHVRDVWSGLLVETDGDELPILDGSAAPWDEALASFAPFPAPPPAAPFRGEARDAGGASARLLAGPRSLTCRIAYDHPALPESRWSGEPPRWPEVLDARTFGFSREAGALRAAGLALGATERNAIVFDEEGARTPLRGPDEPARHKALDALGDLYLLGRPFDAHLEIDRAGHGLHHMLMTTIHARHSTKEASR